jgi:hypothetical protein
VSPLCSPRAARSAGFSAGGGAATKRRMLAIEQARVGDAPDLFDAARPPIRPIATT